MSAMPQRGVGAVLDLTGQQRMTPSPLLPLPNNCSPPQGDPCASTALRASSVMTAQNRLSSSAEKSAVFVELTTLGANLRQTKAQAAS